ncbi:hypothetical protein PM03_09890 [Thalassobacter stenotrophicus]|jgi:hypothetical protein|uniref:DUF1326 domain-containing protein n=2 Tax=Thalassobacter stenotrophicus TaxID=266809 RepID=A0A0N7LSX6_9RHOB|nr:MULTISPECIES: DUF1326 domain-containing protein [Thalassobacter]KGK78882.1 hypothetical protein PM03_09890 [Thalassobacter stenotrophicus]KGL02712.1 hypothetical protein PM04_01620 [Thalassobacter sp. 16PALIMAR09]PVZ47942.1 DUF1326 domain-containing protein [Thalassobacter stenotrophicus]CUH59122.1 hypothetical protein THS5294_00405 [Thalassobacter stenotrophicus]SHJ04884.1 hypothetical protein SAMN02744035_02453 [Thalassobacter stenotrophicus DSM 16310]
MSKQRAEADRLPISQRIDQRMPNPGRRTMNPTNWAIQGELFLNCSCTVFCPCVVSLGAHPPTEGHCHAWMAIAIDDGHFEGESLAGLNVGLLVDIPGRMGEGNWKVAAYVDENATGKAYNGLLQILSGAAGGTTGLFTMLVSEIIGAERAPVEIVRDGKKRSINIGRKIQGEIEMIDGKSPDHPVMVSNSKYWMGPDIIAATGLRSKVRDYGRVWDFGGKSAEICPINWGGPKPL